MSSQSLLSACVIALSAALAGCTTAGSGPRVIDGKMKFVVVEASGGG